MSKIADGMIGRIPALAALSLSGADAVGFAQRICANDVTALAIGAWQWNCVLSPQGRVLALFRLWRRADDRLTLVLPAPARDAARALLERYRLRAKLAVQEDPGVLVGAGVGAEFDSEPDGAAMYSSDGRSLALADAHDPALAQLADASNAWRSQDLAQGVPWLDPGAVESFTPQALSLERLEAFSVRKGCYPGQEIVARMHFLGQNKRELRRFSSGQWVEPGTPLYVVGTPPRSLGTIVMAASSPNGFDHLAVVQRAAGDETLCADPACEIRLRALSLNEPPLPAVTTPLAKA